MSNQLDRASVANMGITYPAAMEIRAYFSSPKGMSIHLVQWQEITSADMRNCTVESDMREFELEDREGQWMIFSGSERLGRELLTRAADRHVLIIDGSKPQLCQCSAQASHRAT